MSSDVVQTQRLPQPGGLPSISWKGFCCGEFSAFHFFLLALLASATYGYQFLMPAFRADDIIQLQPASNDSQMFLLMGRWGYYWVFQHLLGTSSGGAVAGFAGIILQLFSALLIARVIGFKYGGTIFFFCALSTISVLFAHLFSFDSTRLAYPLGNFMAALGLFLCSRKHSIIGVLCMAVAPAFYPAAIQIAVAGALAVSLKTALGSGKGFDFVLLVKYAVMIFVALLLYFFGTKGLYSLLEIEMGGRSSIDVSNLFSDAYVDRFFRLFNFWSVPFLSGYRTSYFSNWVIIPSGAVFFVFLYFVCLRTFSRKRFLLGLVSIGILFVLLVCPYLLSFASPLKEVFPARTLYVFGLVYAILAGLPLERLIGLWKSSSSIVMDRRYGRLTISMTSLAGVLLFGHMVLSNEYASDDYLASQSDLLAVNRIISRIETVAAEEGISLNRKIPIFVYAKTPWAFAGPRGYIRSARFPEHSRSWIFSFVDNRFDPVFGWSDRVDVWKLDAVAEKRPVWPDKDSVFFYEGAAVVVF